MSCNPTFNEYRVQLSAKVWVPGWVKLGEDLHFPIRKSKQEPGPAGQSPPPSLPSTPCRPREVRGAQDHAPAQQEVKCVPRRRSARISGGARSEVPDPTDDEDLDTPEGKEADKQLRHMAEEIRRKRARARSAPEGAFSQNMCITIFGNCHMCIRASYVYMCI